MVKLSLPLANEPLTVLWPHKQMTRPSHVSIRGPSTPMDPAMAPPFLPHPRAVEPRPVYRWSSPSTWISAINDLTIPSWTPNICSPNFVPWNAHPKRWSSTSWFSGQRRLEMLPTTPPPRSLLLTGDPVPPNVLLCQSQHIDCLWAARRRKAGEKIPFLEENFLEITPNASISALSA